MDAILKALQTLDPKNDNHWTADGLPRLETVRLAAANQALTRDEVTAAAPNFSRSTALATTKLAETAPLVAAAAQEEVRNYDEEIANQQRLVEDIRAQLAKGQEVLSREQEVLDDLINAKHDSGKIESTADAIRGYLDSQNKELQERARRAQVLRESGVTLSDIKNLIPQASPLDQALNRKR